jgi:hypothetical protein
MQTQLPSSQLVGMQIPPLDESLGQQQRWTIEFCV